MSHIEIIAENFWMFCGVFCGLCIFIAGIVWAFSILEKNHD